jgi:hypothetical protein
MNHYFGDFVPFSPGFQGLTIGVVLRNPLSQIWDWALPCHCWAECWQVPLHLLSVATITRWYSMVFHYIPSGIK